MKPITTYEDMERELVALLAKDGRLKALHKRAGDLPLRRRDADFAALCNIIVSQLLSVAAANTIWERLQQRVVSFTPQNLLKQSDETLRAAGLSSAKVRTMRAIATEIDINGLDLEQLTSRPATEAHARLCEIKGIGPWTADIFLLFCAGHPDVFPSGDVALQSAVQIGLNLKERPKANVLDKIALAWAPHRGTAARLFWAYYRAVKNGRKTLPI